MTALRFITNGTEQGKRWLAAGLHTPLYRNGYALIISSGSSSGLGMLYWILAARNYTPEVVGRNSAIISAIMLLSSVSLLALTNTMVRFLPNAGQSTRRLIFCSLLISATTAFLTSLAFIYGGTLWFTNLGFLKESAGLIAWFVLSVVGWCLFVLQDSAMTGLRQAAWVPVKNVVFGSAKILILVALAATLPQYGILASWTLPLAPLLLMTGLLIFIRMAPANIQDSGKDRPPLKASSLARYVSGEYFSSMIWAVTIGLLPIVVLQKAGATATAYFYLSWTIAYSIYLISSNLGLSLTAEASRDPGKLPEHARRTLTQMALLNIPAVTIILLSSGWILRLFGSGYLAEGRMVLVLLALSALPNMVTALYVSISRARSHIRQLVVVLATLCALVLGLSLVLLERFGITGIGLAWLLSQILVASTLICFPLRWLWLPAVTRLAPKPLLAAPGDIRWRWEHRRGLSEARRLLPEILKNIPAGPGLPPLDSWSAQRMMRTGGEVNVITLGPNGSAPVVALRLPATAQAALSVHRHYEVVTALWSDPRLALRRHLLPEQLAAGQIGEQPYLVEKILPGVNLSRLLTDPALHDRVLVLAAMAIGDFHKNAAHVSILDEAALRRLVGEPLARVQAAMACSQTLNPAGTADTTKLLNEELRRSLEGRWLARSWTHGDFTPGNVLVAPQGNAVTGIIDWDQGAPDGLPGVDLAQLLLSSRMLLEKKELGEVILEILREGGWRPKEENLLRSFQKNLPVDSPDLRSLALLGWLGLVDGNLSKAAFYNRHRFWLIRNIGAVLSSFGSNARPALVELRNP